MDNILNEKFVKIDTHLNAIEKYVLSKLQSIKATDSIEIYETIKLYETDNLNNLKSKIDRIKVLAKEDVNKNIRKINGLSQVCLKKASTFEFVNERKIVTKRLYNEFENLYLAITDLVKKEKVQ